MYPSSSQRNLTAAGRVFRALPALASLFGAMLASTLVRAGVEALPPDIAKVLREEYVVPGYETRYLAGTVDLNRDQRPEWVVYPVGPMVCGTGGCPTLVFTSEGSGYRLVSAIGISRPPIRVSAASTKGWRNLIVHVGGGGTRSAEVELRFDGTTYPENPTVSGRPVKGAKTGGVQTVIEDFAALEQAGTLPDAGEVAAPSGAAGTGPSFACDMASSAAEQQVCRDAELARLDQALATAFAAGLKQWPSADQGPQRVAQRAWLAERDACMGRPEPRECMRASYQRRLVELQIRNGELVAPAPAGYVCKGHEGEPFTVAFYNQSDPPSAVLTFGERQEIVFVAKSGSGARYTNPRVEFWEHHGEAAVTWSGKAYQCKVR